MNKETFSKIIVPLFENKMKNYTEVTLESWYHVLKNQNEDELKSAVFKIITSEQTNITSGGIIHLIKSERVIHRYQALPTPKISCELCDNHGVVTIVNDGNEWAVCCDCESGERLYRNSNPKMRKLCQADNLKYPKELYLSEKEQAIYDRLRAGKVSVSKVAEKSIGLGVV